MKVEQNALSMLIRLIEHKKVMVENVRRLEVMRGKAITGDVRVPKCHGVQFQTEYGPHCVVSGGFDTELVERLVDTAVQYYQEKTATTGLLLGLAEQAVQKEIGFQLEESLAILLGKEK